jgi:hypothetical protein
VEVGGRQKRTEDPLNEGPGSIFGGKKGALPVRG